MRVSRRENMKKWLRKAKRKTKSPNVGTPSDGAMLSLFYGDLDKTGGHYQVEHIHDTRFREKPWVQVYWWPRRQTGATSAPYTLTEFDL